MFIPSMNSHVEIPMKTSNFCTAYFPEEVDIFEKVSTLTILCGNSASQVS